ncbi:MAG: POTRA domain-containing protein [Bacteroidota bacterium]
MSLQLYRLTFFVFIFLLAIQSGNAQNPVSIPRDSLTADTSSIIISKVVIIGNKITREHIVMRELAFHISDTLSASDFDAKRKRSEENIYNTSLFNSVKLTYLKNPDGTTTIYLILKERWYIFPLPVFEVVDRNFNVWWRTKDFSRIVYGGVLSWNNFRGRNETVALAVRLGYIQQVSFSYSIPYINKNQHSGLNFGFSYSRNHQAAYETSYDDVVYYKDTAKFAREAYSGVIEYTYRKGLYDTHYLSGGFLNVQVQDTVLKLNTEYLANGKSNEHYYSLRYFYRKDRRDYVYYPLRGYTYNVEVVKNGMPFLNDDVNYLFLTAELKKFWQLNRRFYFSTSVRGKLSDHHFQPYYNTRALGFGRDYVRGYEYYVVDGQHFALLKTNFKFELFPKKEVHAGFIPFEKFATIPFSFFINIYGDAGYVEDTQFSNVSNSKNQLPNTWLYGYGIGIDFVTYYDIVIRLDYSFNKFGESGLFLHFAAPI